MGPFTVLKFKDQNFISNIYYRKGPSFTTVSRRAVASGGSPILLHIFQGRHFFSRQCQGEGNTGVVMFQKIIKLFQFVLHSLLETPPLTWMRWLHLQLAF